MRPAYDASRDPPGAANDWRLVPRVRTRTEPGLDRPMVRPTSETHSAAAITRVPRNHEPRAPGPCLIDELRAAPEPDAVMRRPRHCDPDESPRALRDRRGARRPSTANGGGGHRGLDSGDADVPTRRCLRCDRAFPDGGRGAWPQCDDG